MKKLFNRLMFKMGYVPVETKVVNINCESLFKDIKVEVSKELISKILS